MTGEGLPDHQQREVADARRTTDGQRFLGLRTAAAVLAAVIGALISYLALGNVVPAGSNVLTLGPVFVWATVGPHLVLLSLLALVLCLPLWRARHRRGLRNVAAGLAVLSLVSSVAIAATMFHAGLQAGASIGLGQALTLSAPSGGPDDITSYITVDGEAQEARIYLPDGGVEGAPVVMYVHGGGWYGGSAEDSDAMARWYADQGWYVVNVDYRLADAERATWDIAPADVACALTWTVQQAAAAQADPGRLTVAGDSAGGHLATLLGWSSAAQTVTSSCPDLGAVPVPDAVVASYPVNNITYTYDNGTAPLGVDPREFTRFFLGGSPIEQPERLKAVSPSTYQSPSVPPTLVIQPEGDNFIPAEGNYRFAEQAQEAGVDLTMVRVPFSWHGFDAAPGSLGGQIKYSATLDWLRGLDLAP